MYCIMYICIANKRNFIEKNYIAVTLNMVKITAFNYKTSVLFFLERVSNSCLYSNTGYNNTLQLSMRKYLSSNPFQSFNSLLSTKLTEWNRFHAKA